MRQTVVLWEVFVTRFEDVLARFTKRRLAAEEAGEMLGLSGRHFRRLHACYDEDSADGLKDRRLGKPSPKCAPRAELDRAYHNYRLGYTVTRLALQAAGLVKKATRRSAHRHHYVKATVRMHAYPDGAFAAFDGPRCLAHYDAKGGLVDARQRAA